MYVQFLYVYTCTCMCVDVYEVEREDRYKSIYKIV